MRRNRERDQQRRYNHKKLECIEGELYVYLFLRKERGKRDESIKGYENNEKRGGKTNPKHTRNRDVHRLYVKADSDIMS